MNRIKFNRDEKSTVSSTVNRLLDSVLPGHSTQATKPTRKTLVSSTSQIIDASSSKKNLKPEEIRRLKKKEKLAQRKLIRKTTQQQNELQASARYELLISHKKNGTLTPEEQKELKKLVNKNIVNLQSWRPDIDDDLEEAQNEILEMKNEGQYVRTRKRKYVKITAKELYAENEEDQEQRYPGLTPGLAPVDMDDSDSD